MMARWPLTYYSICSDWLSLTHFFLYWLASFIMAHLSTSAERGFWFHYTWHSVVICKCSFSEMPDMAESIIWMTSEQYSGNSSSWFCWNYEVHSSGEILKKYVSSVLHTWRCMVLSSKHCIIKPISKGLTCSNAVCTKKKMTPDL